MTMSFSIAKQNCLSFTFLSTNEELSTLKTNPTAKHMNTATRPYTPIYAVQFKAKPNANGLAINNLLSNSRIFINAETAMKLCKQDPEYRRFKVFNILRKPTRL